MRYKAQDLARVETEARTLARSGRYRGYVEIKRELESRGLPAVARIFINAWSRAEVDRLCRHARASA
jgi:hypothetical protein